MSYEIEMKDGDVPSGTRVTAQPPPPAPVSFVLRRNCSAAVVDRMSSSDGCETPRVTRCEWFSSMRAYVVRSVYHWAAQNIR